MSAAAAVALRPLRPLLAAGRALRIHDLRFGVACSGCRLSLTRPWGSAGLPSGIRATSSEAAATSYPPAPQAPPAVASASGVSTPQKFYRERLMDGEEEVLTEAEKQEKDAIMKELTQKLSGPLADEHGNVPTGKDRPIAIEVDGPSHFYANSKRYTAYTKLKHRLLTRMGYKVLHVPYFDWRKLRGAREREEYMRAKLMEEPTEWLDPEDERYYNAPPEEDEEETSYKPQGGHESAPATPAPPPPRRAAPAAKAAAPRAPAPPAAGPEAAEPEVAVPPAASGLATGMPSMPMPPPSPVRPAPVTAAAAAAAPPPPPKTRSRAVAAAPPPAAPGQPRSPPPPPQRASGSEAAGAGAAQGAGFPRYPPPPPPPPTGRGGHGGGS